MKGWFYALLLGASAVALVIAALFDPATSQWWKDRRIAWGWDMTEDSIRRRMKRALGKPGEK